MLAGSNGLLGKLWVIPGLPCGSRLALAKCLFPQAKNSFQGRFLKSELVRHFGAYMFEIASIYISLRLVPVGISIPWQPERNLQA